MLLETDRLQPIHSKCDPGRLTGLNSQSATSEASLSLFPVPPLSSCDRNTLLGPAPATASTGHNLVVSTEREVLVRQEEGAWWAEEDLGV